MSSDLEKAQMMFKLIRKGNWGNKYDRLEHFKRFQNRDEIVDELIRKKWLIRRKKPNFVGISLDTNDKSKIVEFIKKHIPDLKGIDWTT